MRIVWSPTARRRAQQAVDFIEQDRPLVSVEWLEGLSERVKALAGDKTGDDRWYDVFVPKADDLYDEHLEILRKEGLI